MSEPVKQMGYRTEEAMGFSPRDRGVTALQRWMGLVLAPVIWTVPGLLLTAVVTALTGLIFTPLGWFFSPVIGLFVTFSLYQVLQMRRRRDGELVLGYLESAMRLNFPLPSFLLAAAKSERGGRQWRIMALRRELENGVPVNVALAAATDLPDATIEILAAHESIGQLPLGLTRVVEAEEAKQRRAAGQDRALYGFYQVYLIFFILALMIAYMIFILPKFRDILKDFKTEVPPLTMFFVQVSDFFFNREWWWGLMIILLINVAIVLPMTVWMQRAFFPAWPLPRLSRGAQWIAWRLPLLRRLQQDRGLALTCELLAEATRSGVPLPEAIDRALILPLNRGFRRKLVVWRDELLKGRGAAEGAQQAGLPAALVGFLAPAMGTAQETGQANMFDFLGNHYRQRFSRSLEMLKAASEPMLVVGCGSVAMFFTVALMLPLVRILQSVEAYGPGGSL